MKAKLFLITLSVFFLSNCKEKEPEPETKQTKTESLSRTINMSSNETHSFDLEVTENAQIINDVENGSRSEISSADSLSNLFYYYTPTNGFVGLDTVSIETCEEKEDDVCYDTKIYKVYFNVTEPTSYTIDEGPCGELSFLGNIGSNHSEALDSLKKIRAEYTDGKEYFVDENVVTVTEPIDDRIYKTIEFKNTGSETNIISLADVLDENGNHFFFTKCDL